jgi:3-deoxy-D-manno-octulosonic-acid transferase
MRTTPPAAEARMRILYNLLIYLAAPIAFLAQVMRGLGDPDCRQGRWQRFGLGEGLPDGSIWVHAVSVGEVQASAPLVRALLQRYPARRLVLTTVTPTGAARARSLFGDAVALRYLPFDLPGSVRRFFERVKPSIAIIMETELWPNLLAECNRRGIPLLLASARISPRSVRRYRRLASLFGELLSKGIIVAAQSEADAQRFRSIGANPARTHVTGNIKFDIVVDPDVCRQGGSWRETQAGGRPIWVAGSTHEGEERLVLDAHAKVCAEHAAALLVLVPRHPNRFAEVAALLDQRGVSWVSRSSGKAVRPETGVVLGDTMGELMMFYAAADVAFVAGSLVPVGGHNLLEPIAVGASAVTGPHNFNGEEIYRKLVEAGVVMTVADADELSAAVAGLLADAARRRELGECGRRVVEENRGALDRLLALVGLVLGAGVQKPAGHAAGTR